MTRSHRYVPDLPDGPPPEVLAEIDAAWERAQALVDDDEYELHFESDPLLHRAFGELRLGGRFERRLSATEAVAIACGDGVGHRALALAV